MSYHNHSITTSYFCLICRHLQDVMFTGIRLRIQKTNLSCFRCIVSWVSLYCLSLAFVVLSLGFRCTVSWVSLYCLAFVVLSLLGFVVLSLGFRCIVSWFTVRWSWGGGGGRGVEYAVRWNNYIFYKKNPNKENGFEYSMLIIFFSPRSPPPYIFTTDCVVSDCNRSWTINTLISCCDGFS